MDGPWTLPGALWESLWLTVALLVGYAVAHRFGNRLLSHAAERQRIIEWHHVGRRARGQIRQITIELVFAGMIRGLPARVSSLGRDAFQVWADAIRLVMVRRPSHTKPLTMAEIKSDEGMRLFAPLQNLAPDFQVAVRRLSWIANLFRDAFPDDLRRALLAACLELEALLAVTKPVRPEHTEAETCLQLTQNGEAAARAFDALAELVRALDRSVSAAELAEWEVLRSASSETPR